MKARQRFFGGGPMGLALNIGLLWAAFRFNIDYIVVQKEVAPLDEFYSELLGEEGVF